MYAFSLAPKQNKTRPVKYVLPCESKVKMQRKNAEATFASLLPTSLIYIILITITLLARL